MEILHIVCYYVIYFMMCCVGLFVNLKAEFFVLDCCFMVLLLFQLLDNKDAYHVKTYDVSLKDKDFIAGPWS